MTIQVVGAGVGRTGTHSLKIALERLLGGTCHHMIEVFTKPEQQAGFTAAIDGRHNAAVRAEIPADRLIDWTPNDGWKPICEHLGIAIPDDSFRSQTPPKSFDLGWTSIHLNNKDGRPVWVGHFDVVEVVKLFDDLGDAA